jgi:uncharacterized protein (TIGR02266 family)
MPGRPSDKRSAPRFSINREFDSVDEFIREYAMNVSLDGCFIRTNEVLPKGAHVRLKFTVILDELETIEGTGEVVRVIPPGGSEPAGVGVVFTALTDKSRDVLVKLFLRQRPAKK